MTVEEKINQLRELFADAPQRPVVPAGAPGELRLDAAKSDVVPEFPY